jgi:DNA-binding NarL/FixJ family response regulator
MSLRVSLVEDHPVLRDVLQEYIGQLPGVELCVVSANAEDALDEFEGSMPDLMLTDLSFPRISGNELISELHLRQPDQRCAIITGQRAPA